MRDQLPGIRSSILAKLMQQFREQFQFEVAEYRDSIIDMLPSKKAELERMQKANEEEKARMAAELKAREQAEAARIEAERKRKEEEEAAKKKMQAEASEIGSLFGQQAVVSPAGYQPKTSSRSAYTSTTHRAFSLLYLCGGPRRDSSCRSKTSPRYSRSRSRSARRWLTTRTTRSSSVQHQFPIMRK